MAGKIYFARHELDRRQFDKKTVANHLIIRRGVIFPRECSLNHSAFHVKRPRERFPIMRLEFCFQLLYNREYIDGSCSDVANTKACIIDKLKRAACLTITDFLSLTNNHLCHLKTLKRLQCSIY